MNCNEAIEYIHSLGRFGIKPGLERVKELCALLGEPQKSLKFIHVAGTNGKGSTCTMISEIFHKAGYTVGLYTSPYVVDFRERMKVNGRMIDPYELAKTVQKVKTAVEKLNAKGMEPTEFEVITAAAFLFFKNAGCDLVVLEVGLGGRFDATNIIDTPLVSVIASISMDHTEILGDTLAKIAFEKCGIIKNGGVTVTYPEQSSEALEVIKQSCAEKANRLVVPGLDEVKINKSDAFGTVFTYRSLEIFIPLTGIHMVKNAITAIEAVMAASAFGFNAGDSAIIEGIAASAMPARLEVLRKKPLVILDGGHNEGCGRALADYIKAYLPGKRIVALCSMMADKDYPRYLQLTAPLFETFIASKASVPRALGAEELKAEASKYCKNAFSVADPLHALKFAESIVEENDVLLVCGSFYFAADIREDLLNF